MNGWVIRVFGQFTARTLIAEGLYFNVWTSSKADGAELETYKGDDSVFPTRKQFTNAETAMTYAEQVVGSQQKK